MADLRSVAGTAGAGLTRAGRGVQRGASAFWRFVRKGVDAQGARESGLSRLIELHGVNGIGDALVAVGLAGTLFFSVPVGEARPRVALYLLVTMAPFALLAPVVGPMLDRFSHGRRYALATTMLARAFLAWIMAGSLHGLALYPAAFGVLVMSKAYGVARSAAVPRLLPPNVSLVAANSRLSLAAIICATIAAPIGIGLAQIGLEWPLRVATVAFLAAMVLALRLPAKVDSEEGERTVRLRSGRRPLLPHVTLGRPVVVALRSSAALRALSGFLTLFLAFLLRT
ncbi:MAG: MFS transporter, partial [Actinomycetota bacterium]|nr:MFS transporter [Actinomycetota bacterium]